MASRYHEIYESWKRDPEAFWREAAKGVDWYRPFDTAFDPHDGVYGRWFAGGVCNTCHNAVDRHVAAGRGDQPALIHDSAMTGKVRTYTYLELQREDVALAQELWHHNVR